MACGRTEGTLDPASLLAAAGSGREACRRGAPVGSSWPRISRVIGRQGSSRALTHRVAQVPIGVPRLLAVRCTLYGKGAGLVDVKDDCPFLGHLSAHEVRGRERRASCNAAVKVAVQRFAFGVRRSVGSPKRDIWRGAGAEGCVRRR
jgi:hypothetical protein